MKRTPVFSVVAEDWWEYELEGETYVAHVCVGVPREGDSGWVCPLRIDGAHEVWNPFSRHKRWKGWKPIRGTGPFDAVMNALLLAFRMFAEHKPRSMPRPKLVAPARRAAKRRGRARR